MYLNLPVHVDDKPHVHVHLHRHAHSVGQVYNSLAAGLTFTSITTIFLPVSGAHTNPSITLAALSIGRVSHEEAAGYLTAQCGGGIAGASAMLCLYGAHDYTDAGYDRVAVGVMECILTCMMVMVYLTVTEPGSTHPPISIGITNMACLAAYRGPLNPATALAQAFLRNRWDNIWLLLAAPIVGGVGGALCYQHVFRDIKDVKVVLNTNDEESDGEEGEHQFIISSMDGSCSLSTSTCSPLPSPTSLPLPRRDRQPLSYSVHTVTGASYPHHHHAQLVTLQEPQAGKKLLDEDDSQLNNKRYTKSGVFLDSLYSNEQV
jgi:aquaporin Z